MQDYEQAVLVGLLRRLRGLDASGGIASRGSLRREQSLNEQRSTRHKPGYYAFFCIHDVHRWTKCAKCRRNQAQANAEKAKHLAKLVELSQKHAETT